jgi:hypothetical protein
MRTSGFGRYALIICVAVAMLAGCNASTHSNQQQPGSSSPAASEPALSPTTSPEYAAVDYDKPGHPQLTPDEVASIRSALARVKPCQRTLVRYAFPDSAELPFVIFFQPESGQGAPVFGEPRTYYLIVDGEVVTASPTDPYADQVEKFGIQYIIDHQGCAPVLE